jgi:uncharacterized protein YrrD
MNRPFVLAGSIRGLPVVARAEASFVGKLDDFLVRLDNLAVIGFKLRAPGFFGGARGVAAAAVERIGRDYVIVGGESAVEEGGASRGTLDDRVWWSDWAGVRFIERRGGEVGRLQDLLLASDGSAVHGFLVDGNRLVVPSAHCAVGADSLILESAAAAARLPGPADSAEWWAAVCECLSPACAPPAGR